MHSRDLIEQYKTYVQDWRRYFHKHPELSNEEFETTKTLAKELESMGVEVHVDTDVEQVSSALSMALNLVKRLPFVQILMPCLYRNIIHLILNPM